MKRENEGNNPFSSSVFDSSFRLKEVNKKCEETIHFRSTKLKEKYRMKIPELKWMANENSFRAGAPFLDKRKTGLAFALQYYQ